MDKIRRYYTLRKAYNNYKPPSMACKLNILSLEDGRVNQVVLGYAEPPVRLDEDIGWTPEGDLDIRNDTTHARRITLFLIED